MHALKEGLGWLFLTCPTCPEKLNPDTAAHLTFFMTFLDCLCLAGMGQTLEPAKVAHTCTILSLLFRAADGEKKHKFYNRISHLAHLFVNCD